MGITIWSTGSFADAFNKPIDYFGEEAFLFHRTHRLCRFVKALACANMWNRLSDEDASEWLPSVEVFKLPGLHRDKFHRAVQLRDLENLGLIDCYYEHRPRGLWESEFIKISNVGLEAVKILKTDSIGLLVIHSGSRARCIATTGIDILG